MARLVDTSVFIDFERRGLSVTAFVAAAPDEPTVMASITAAELLVGIERADPGARRRQRAAFIERILAEVSVVPFDLAVARVHARVLAQLQTAGQVIGANDVLIAATALTHGYRVITHNLRDFRRVPGLVVHELAWYDESVPA